MSRTPRWSLKASALGASFAILLAACGGGTASTAPSTAASTAPSQAASSAPSSSAAAFTAKSYPDAAIDCANPPKYTSGANTAAYSGIFKQIKALDRLTVEFDLCAADVAFLSKIAFASNNIQDSEWLLAHAKDKSIVHDAINGTGAYQVKSWVAGSSVTLEANPNYWGDAPKAQTVVVKWAKDATQRLQDLQSGNVDGIDNVAPDDFATVTADPNLQLLPRVALSTLYMGFNVNSAPWNNEKVRQAIAVGIDRKRIADNFYPAGSEAADYFTPCSIPLACGGDKWYATDIAAAKAALTAAGFDFSKTYDFHYRTKVRSYLPSPTQVATDIQAQLRDNLGVKIALVVEKDDTYLGDESRGKFPLFLLGWGADYPDVTDFLDVHFGTGANSGFGKKFDDVTAALTKGASETDQTKRAQDYVDANNLVRTHVPMVPLVHGASATAWKKDVTGAHSSPIGSEYLNVMTPGTRTQLVWSQNSEPSGLYCGDESDGDALRICTQVFDSLYNYKVAGLDPVPALATSCDPSADAKTWTCKLRDGVKFQKAGELDANDVVDSFAVQWDVKNPLHVGNLGANWYWPTLFAGCLNPNFDSGGAQTCAVAQ
ncbi:MAG: peptide/nickel transport system substrate-binding protein [Chloroflexota bacterium]|nr:peptide/nickel transport system substrate-binding protein [Chloroflexota bacterium]